MLGLITQRTLLARPSRLFRFQFRFTIVPPTVRAHGTLLSNPSDVVLFYLDRNPIHGKMPTTNSSENTSKIEDGREGSSMTNTEQANNFPHLDSLTLESTALDERISEPIDRCDQREENDQLREEMNKSSKPEARKPAGRDVLQRDQKMQLSNESKANNEEDKQSDIDEACVLHSFNQGITFHVRNLFDDEEESTIRPSLDQEDMPKDDNLVVAPYSADESDHSEQFSQAGSHLDDMDAMNRLIDDVLDEYLAEQNEMKT